VPPAEVPSAKASTVSVSGELVTAAKLVSPLYTAVIGSAPTGILDVMNVATPLAMVPVPNIVVLSKKVTDPVGAVKVEETVAVSVMLLCESTGFAVEVKAMAGVALFTVNVTFCAPAA
jgi:hypothetical protein